MIQQDMYELQAAFQNDDRVPPEVTDRGIDILERLTDVERKCDWYRNCSRAYNILKKRLVEVRLGAALAELEWEQYVKEVEKLRVKVIKKTLAAEPIEVRVD